MSRPVVQFDGEQYWPQRFHLHPGAKVTCPSAALLELDLMGHVTGTSNFDAEGLELPERLREKSNFDKFKWCLAKIPHRTYTVSASGDTPIPSHVRVSPERVWRDRHGQPFVLA